MGRAFIITAFVALASISYFVLHKRVLRYQIELTNERLLLGGEEISTLIINPKDGFPDFPKSDYDTFNVLPLKIKLEDLAHDSEKTLLVRIPDSQLYAVWKPIIVTAQTSGFKKISIECINRKRTFFGLQKSIIIANEAASFHYISDADSQYPSIFIDRDSVIVKYSNLWPYSQSPSSSVFDSTINAIFVQSDLKDRIYSIGSGYSMMELTNLVNALKRAKPAARRFNLQINPKSTCLEIFKFTDDFKNVWIQEMRSAASLDYYDYVLKFRINIADNGKQAIANDK